MATYSILQPVEFRRSTKNPVGICFSCLLRHTSTCMLTVPRVNKENIYFFSFHLKTEVST